MTTLKNENFLRNLAIPAALSVFTAVAVQNDVLTSLDPITLLACLPLVTAAVMLYLLRSPNVYMLNFSTFQSMPEHRASRYVYETKCRASGFFQEDDIQWMMKVLDSSGIGDEAGAPPGYLEFPPRMGYQDSHEELRFVYFRTVDDLLAKTGIKPQDIDVVITQTANFVTFPSPSALIVNHYKMRDDVLTYHLGGMGCSAAPITVGLAAEVLKNHPNKRALVVTGELVTPNGYTGRQREFYVANVLFRAGAAAFIMSSKPEDKARSNYRLDNVVRSHFGADDAAIWSAFETTDDEDNKCIRLAKELPTNAARCLAAHFKHVGAKQFPLMEQLRYVWIETIQRKLLKKSIEPYFPNWRAVTDHFALHPGGAKVVAALQKSMRLSEDQIAPIKRGLNLYGNTSSSSCFYVMQCLEDLKRVKKGDRVWQMAFGSGFKVNSAFWTCIKTPEERKTPAYLSQPFERSPDLLQLNDKYPKEGTGPSNSFTPRPTTPVSATSYPGGY